MLKNIFNNFVAEKILDFHDFGKTYPFEVERITNHFIEDAFFEGKKNLLIITGKGEVVRPAVAKVLESNKYVKSFKSAGYFNGQTGAFEIILNS